MYVSRWLDTPLGRFKIIGSELGIRSVSLREPKAVQKDGSVVPVPPVSADEPVSDTPLPETHPVLECSRQMADYFAGQRQDFDLKLDWSGTPEFHRLVWAELVKIPFGKTVSYSDIAERVGNPAAVRAVGMANRSNPIAIVVPCHRVIGKAGELRGYYYGLDTKMVLLRHENPVRFAEQGELF